ncbi:MAG: acetate kinase [Bacillales bacterium]|nr:acetate kinase [Bacillales bacterium]
MKIMAINAGSSSLKFQLLEMPAEKVITKGLVERIGLNDSIFKISVNGEEVKTVKDIPNHSIAVKDLLNALVEHKIIASFNEIDGVGHRVVHGGEIFSDSVLITDQVLEQIESLNDLAPLHNPANLIGIRAFQEILPNVPQVAVFDTAFHASMPKENYMYGVPKEYYEKYSVRKYGFHGTSHNYVSHRAAEILGKPIEDLKIISCHLGNGASITAIKDGKSFDTTMGFTPLAGLTMGTRCGNIDPAIIPYLMEKTGKDINEIMDVLNKESGVLGLTGFSSDFRDIEEAIEAHDDKSECAETALNVFIMRIKQFIGAYVATMSGVDVLIFTAGIGENSVDVRERILNGLEFFGISYDKEKNNCRGKEVNISAPDSKIEILIIPTNEEGMIAKDVIRLMNQA